MPVSAPVQASAHGWANLAAYAALYTTVSEDDGTPVEVDGAILDILGAPIYTRQAVALSDVVGGSQSSLLTPTFGVPAGTRLAWWGLLDAAGAQLTIEPLTDSVQANVPQACLFNDLEVGWIDKPGGLNHQQAVGTYVVFWSGPAPNSTVYSIGGYTTLPSNIWAAGAYAVWPVRDIDGERFTINARAGFSATAASRYDTDTLIPSNYGWGYWQRLNPIVYAVDGTYTLGLVRVRTVG